MNSCFGSNNWLWLLIIILVCCCGSGSVCGIFDKLSDCSCLIPIILVLLCCCGDKHNNKGLNFGCGCK
ncbi:MAG: chorion class high-cysteine HCB protein 13 [Clostridia bacterium]|nr:chorion class high-cysteine HCB protein 13 [Clostridia bacterium]